MQTLREAISDIVGDLRASNLDDKYSYRFIASKIQGYIESFLRQDSVDRSILKINELWKPLFNIELKDEADYIYNSLYEPQKTLKKSTKKIPEVFTSKYGNLIKIMNLDNSSEYMATKSFKYKDIKAREYSDSRIKYYWIEDGFLFIPDSEIEEVKGFGLFKDSQEADLFNGTIDCCYKPLDSILLVPDYIISLAKRQVLSDLLPEKQIVEDSTPDLSTQSK